ncbi:MAG TPA: NYN domain-containing protein [Pyrinomonadaceae bacterium]|nr:NYN domain-containing protein [Pyrinomonadaceae bacterium]
MHFDPTNNISWLLGYRGRVAVFIDGNNLFHAARFHNIDIDYNKLLRVLLGDGRLLRAFFYTGVDVGAERQQGFLLWMRRNGFRVIHKELKTFYDGSRKANLDVEIAVDMLSLAGRYDTAVLVSGDEDFVYAVNAVAYKGCRVEVAGFRSNTAPKLIDVADYFIDLGEIAEKVRKELPHGKYYEHHPHEEVPPAYVPHDHEPLHIHAAGGDNNHLPLSAHLPPHEHVARENHNSHRNDSHEIFTESAACAITEVEIDGELEQLRIQSHFIRVTDEQ